jgi:ribonuclease J
LSLEENVNENVKPETSTENKTENNTGENREEGTKTVRRPQNRRPRRVPRVPKAVKAEEKEENGSRETAEPKTEEKRKAAPARGRQQGTKRSFPAVKEAGEKRAPLRKPTRNSQKEAKSKLKIIPLGGLEQIGMNITAFEYEDSIIVVDCGLAFPGDDMLGIDLVIPDVSYLKQNIDKVKGFVITHGHEDHIGALPYILQQVNVPVYGTKLTIALIEHKLKEHNLLKNTKRKVMKHGQSVNLGCFRVEFIKTNHSIQDASALAIFSPVGIVLHTGDFKIDYTPVFGDPIDLQRFAELGKKGVLAMLADSTNATRPGFTMSERSVGKTFDTIFAEHTNHRIIVATFASNVDRVQQVVNTAYKYGRKVVVEGRSMVTIIDIASELGYINIPEGTLIDIDQLKNYPPESTVLITTGSQGESMAALSRMAASIHKKVSIVPGDVVVLSSTPIPGNEKAVANVINELSAKGAKVICQDTHVSGHACQEDLKLIYSLVHPKFAIPVHGEFRHRMAQKELAEYMGVQKENALLVNSGDVVSLDEDSCQVTDHVACGSILVDGLGVGDVGNIVLRDRQNLAQNGIIVVVLTLEKHSNQLLSGPDIVSRGFVYVRESEDLLEEAHSVVADAVADCLDRHVSDWGKIKNIIKDSLSDFLWKRMKRNPMILPIIMEV